MGPLFSLFSFAFSLKKKKKKWPGSSHVECEMICFIHRLEHFYCSFVLLLWLKEVFDFFPPQGSFNFMFLQTYYNSFIILGKFVQWKTIYIPYRKCHTTVKYVSDICKYPKISPAFKNFIVVFQKETCYL